MPPSQLNLAKEMDLMDILTPTVITPLPFTTTEHVSMATLNQVLVIAHSHLFPSLLMLPKEMMLIFSPSDSTTIKQVLR